MTNDMLNELNFEELNSLSEEEKKLALEILKDFSVNGKSEKYDDLRYYDYKEIPVDIETFLHDKRYLGAGLINDEGKFTVFPYWVETLKKIFPNNIDTAYNTLVLSGSIGIGKSFVAVICMLYMLYRMMCLKDPYKHFGLQPIDKITFSFINITMDAAKGVAWDKCQQLLQSSEWFLMRGRVSKSLTPEWQPLQDIELIYGSQPRHIIGRAVYCLDGDTEILTTEGVIKIKEGVGKDLQVISVDENGNTVVSDVCTVVPTVKASEEYEIELEDGTVIRCTPNHKLMLANGTYKEAQYLSEDDELAEIQHADEMTYKEFIDSIIKVRGQWGIPDNEYCEAHHIVPRCMGGSGSARSGSRRSKHPNIIWLYAHEHFIAHKLLAKENPNNAKLVYAWSMMAFPKGKTNRHYEISPDEYEMLRVLQSNICSGSGNSMYGKEPWNKGKTGVYSEESLAKMRVPRPNMRGIKKSDETKAKMSIAVRNRDKSTFAKPHLGKVCITNGEHNRFIEKDEPLPEGYHYGGKSHSDVDSHKKVWTDEKRKEWSEKYSGCNNPNYGNGAKMAGGNNSHAIYVYTFEGIDYQCRDDLIKVLKMRWEDISESAIRRIQKGKYTKRISRKYQYIIDNLTWRLKSNEDKSDSKS